MALTPRRDPGGRVAVTALLLLVLASAARAAEPSNGATSFQRGLDADLGWGTARDAGEAYRDYAEAARTGSADAELNLGVMNDSGVGRPRDAAMAALWYARAASHADGRAAYDLAQLYATGDGVPKNPSLAAAWFGQAAAEGIAAATQSARRVKEATQHTDDTVLLPPVLREPGLPEAGAPTAELVWDPQASGPGLRYWVEVRRTEGGVPGTIAFAETAVSAMRVALPAGDGAYAWRVFVANERLGHYVASDWMAFRVRPHGAGALAANQTCQDFAGRCGPIQPQSPLGSAPGPR